MTLCEHMRITHEEADVIIIHQMLCKVASGKQNIIVICDDTDVFLLLVHHYTELGLTCQITMTGVSPQRSVVDIGASVDKNADI